MTVVVVESVVGAVEKAVTADCAEAVDCQG